MYKLLILKWQINNYNIKYYKLLLIIKCLCSRLRFNKYLESILKILLL